MWNPERDSDGAMLARKKTANKGETMHVQYVEITTSKLSSLVNQDEDGVDIGDATLKFYNSSDVELTTQASIDTDCVKTVLEWEPTYDYEIIGGYARALTAPTTNVRLWCIAVPDIAAPNGSKIMISGCNFKFMNDKEPEKLDGRSAKFMTYDAILHTNKIQKIIRHDAGVQCEILIEYEVYKV